MKRRWFSISAIGLFLITGVSWAYYAYGSTIKVSATPASSLPDGTVANVIPYTGTQTVALSNRPHKTSGLELDEIDVGNSSFSNHIRVMVDWTNPQDNIRALHKGWIEVGVYYPSSSGTFLLPDGTTKVALDPSTFTILNPRNADAVLLPDIAGQNKLYILASIVNSGNNIPPGQQVTGELQFFVQVGK